MRNFNPRFFGFELSGLWIVAALYLMHNHYDSAAMASALMGLVTLLLSL